MVSAVGRDGEIVEAPKWNGIELPLPIPLNAMALDEDAALMMLTWYPEEQWHRLHFAPGIDLDAIKTRAAASKRWP
jgi:hypothetical protein